MRNLSFALIATTLLIGGCSKVPSSEVAAREVDSICQQIYHKMFTKDGQPIIKVQSRTDGGGVCHALVDVEGMNGNYGKQLTYEVDITYEDFGDNFTYEGMRPRVINYGTLPPLGSEEELFSYADYALAPNCAAAIRTIAKGELGLWNAEGQLNSCATASYRVAKKLEELDKANPVAQAPAKTVCEAYAANLTRDPMQGERTTKVNSSKAGSCEIVYYIEPSDISSVVAFSIVTLDYRNTRGGGIHYTNVQTRGLDLTLAEDGSIAAQSINSLADLQRYPTAVALFQQVAAPHLEFAKKMAAQQAIWDAETAASRPY